jgi:hypothetical protein
VQPYGDEPAQGLTAWEVEGGEWRQSGDRIEGAARGTGRLWLRKRLPSDYSIQVTLSIEAGVAGFSCGHLKDYCPPTPEDGEPARGFGVQVSGTNLYVFERPGGVLSLALFPLTWRACAVGSLADIGDRVSLFVSGGRTTFDSLRLTIP